MTTEINTEATVGQLVTERPARSRVFESLGIDYCCGGKFPLADACEKRGLDASRVIDLLRLSDAEDREDEGGAIDPDSLSLTALADHIERVHHGYLRTELPRLDAITEKVSRVHGDREPRLGEVRRVFCVLRDEMNAHTQKEEQVLFPMIRQIDQNSGPKSFGCGSIANPIGQMEAEHDAAGDALATMRAATDGYTAPEWACNTYRAMLDGLAQLERDMHQHVHKENNVLFPKAIKREGELARGCQGS